MSSMVNCSEREVASVSFKVDFDKFRVLGHTKCSRHAKRRCKEKCHLNRRWMCVAKLDESRKQENVTVAYLNHGVRLFFIGFELLNTRNNRAV